MQLPIIKKTKIKMAFSPLILFYADRDIFVDKANILTYAPAIVVFSVLDIWRRGKPILFGDSFLWLHVN
jgi:hypothetical protein